MRLSWQAGVVRKEKSSRWELGGVAHAAINHSGSDTELGVLARASRWLGSRYKFRLSLGRVGLEVPIGLAFDAEVRAPLLELKTDSASDASDDMLFVGVSTTNPWASLTVLGVEIGLGVATLVLLAGTH